MADKHEFHQNTWQKIRRARSLAELVEILEHLLVLAKANDLSEDEYELLSMTFSALEEFTFDEPAKGKQLILKYLLPTIDLLGKVKFPSLVLSDCIECLADWISQYSRLEQIALRDEVLDSLVQGLQSAPQISALRSISLIGYRRPDIVNALWNVAECYKNKTGDTALSVLVSLGVPVEERRRLLGALHERATKRSNHPLVSALRRLADRSSIDVVQQYWLKPRKSPCEDKSQAMRILLDICDRHETDTLLQDYIWHIVSELFRQDEETVGFSIYLGGYVTALCNSQSVVPDMLRWLQLNQADFKNDEYTRYLSYIRLEECVRPQQLRGWEKASLCEVIEILRQDALQDTLIKVLALTDKSMLKENAWQTLLRLGYAEALNWSEEALFSETNPSVSAYISELLACFSLTPLPPTVRKWVTGPYNDTKNSYDYPGEFTVRTVAIQLARSAASYEAFEALLNFGFTMDGKGSRDSMWALADVGNYLVKLGEADVVDKLVKAVVNSPKTEQRMAAVGALELFIAPEMVSTEQVSKLVPLIHDAQRHPYERRALIGILGHLPDLRVTSDVLNSLKEWAQSQDDWLGIRSLETLARLDCLLDQPELLTHCLGLQQIGNQWDLSPEVKRFDKVTFIIYLLYSHHTERFTPAIVSLVRTQDRRVTKQITDLLTRFHEQNPNLDLSKSLEEALIERVRTRQSRSLAETYMFQLLARLVPNRLATEKWEEIWDYWMSNGRAALADSLGKATYTTANANKQATSLLLLLTRDGQYAVRRAAYRGLSRHSSSSHLSLCKALAEAPEVELRQRAAEAIGWLGNEENASQIFTKLYQELVTDREPTVRERAERIRLERRERLWAEQYLAIVCQVEGKSNQEVLSCWRYGDALTQIGDDGAIEALRTHLATRPLPPNVRYWIGQLIKGIGKRWKKETEKWPKPWLAWEGAIEEGQGLLLYEESQKAKVHYSIWHKAVPNLKHSWGGKIWLTEKPHFEPNGSELRLQLEDGRQAKAVASRYSLLGQEVTLAGNGRYPT